jgi:putative transposase
MARGKRYQPEQVVNLLRQIEVAIANGKTTAQACKEAEIVEQTYFRWRKEYGGLQVDQAKRLKELELENVKVRRLDLAKRLRELEQENAKLKRSLEDKLNASSDFLELVNALRADTESIPSHLSPTQADRRRLVRSIFAFIEAITFSIKNLSVIHNETTLNEAEKALAQEKTYYLKESGEIGTRAAKINSEANIKFAFHIFSRVFAVQNPLDTSNSGWERLLRSIKVRDCITHPKRPSDLLISDTEMTEVLKAFKWYNETCVQLVLDKLSTA